MAKEINQVNENFNNVDQMHQNNIPSINRKKYPVDNFKNNQSEYPKKTYFPNHTASYYNNSTTESMKHPFRKSLSGDNSIHTCDIPYRSTETSLKSSTVLSESKNCLRVNSQGVTHRLKTSELIPQVQIINSYPKINPKNYYYKRNNPQGQTYKRKIYPVNKTSSNRFDVLQQLS